MNKTINKNFSFLLDEKITLSIKNEVIDYINDIHDNINKNQLNGILSNLRKISENVLKEFISNKNIEPKNRLSELIKQFEDNFGYDQNSDFISLCHEIRIWGNKDAHDIKSEQPTISKIVVATKNTRDIIWYLFGNEEKIGTFNEIIYFENSKEKIKDNRIIDYDEDQSQKFNNDIEIQKASLIQWMTRKDTILLIPIYQRGYEWTIDQIEVLFDDIYSRYKDNSIHYFGIIAGKKIDPKEIIGGTTYIKIMDGQQRLTTAFLFMCAIRDIIKEKFNNDINILEKEKLINSILRKNIKDYFYNPGGTYENNETFRSILKGDFLDINEKNKYFINYSKFKELILNKNFSIPELRKFANTFLTKFELGTISFDNENISNKKEMEIFENLNSKGKDLETSDLIKNYIFNLCSEKLLQENEEEIPKNYNIYIINELKNKNEIIDTENFYKILSEYNSGVETSSNKQLQLNNLKETIIKLFMIQENTEFEKIKDYINFLKEIKNYAALFFDFKFKKGSTYGKILGVEKIIKLCAIKDKINLFIGLSFLIVDILKINYKLDKDESLKEFLERVISTSLKREIMKIFIVLMKFITKHSIVTIQGDSSLKRDVIQAIYNTRIKLFNNKEIKMSLVLSLFEEEIKKYAKTDEQFKVSLLNNDKDRKAMTWLLVLTEWELSDFINGGQIADYDNPSIEHVLPQKNEKWIDTLKKEEDWEYRFPIMLNKIGNYFIINQSKNSSASNINFLEKKKTWKENSSPLYKNDNPDIDIYNKQEWSFDTIEKRTIALVNYICEKVIKHNN
ncbi:MAG: DUF262 domain-containing protein [Metamycoplasmataceae bacterium]